MFSIKNNTDIGVNVFKFMFVKKKIIIISGLLMQLNSIIPVVHEPTYKAWFKTFWLNFKEKAKTKTEFVLNDEPGKRTPVV